MFLTPSFLICLDLRQTVVHACTLGSCIVVPLSGVAHFNVSKLGANTQFSTTPFTLSNRSIESLYEELVEQGIIKKVQNVKMSEFEGEYSYLGTTLRQANIEPMPSLSDVRRVVTEFGVLPLGKSVFLQAIETTGINHKGPKTHHFFPGLFFYVQIESPNPENPEDPIPQAQNPIN